MKFDFVGPKGVAFPQRQPLIDSFDDSERKDRIAEEKKAEREEKIARAEEDLKRGTQLVTTTADGRAKSTEFTDREIEDAFRFIDLDHNQFVGAAELRHVLICMGELITDEEVDMMIQMVDVDGDGQVSCVWGARFA